MTLADGLTRYEYSIKKIADQECVWSLANDDGWALAGDDTGQECVPIWPHAEYATACAVDVWSGHEPKPIAFEAWLARWTPGMERDGRQIAVFPTTGQRGVVTPPGRFADDLRAELAKYE